MGYRETGFWAKGQHIRNASAGGKSDSNDKFHLKRNRVVSLKAQELPCPLTAKINCRSIHWSNTGTNPGPCLRNIVRYFYRRKEEIKPVSLFQTANYIFQHSIACDIII